MDDPVGQRRNATQQTLNIHSHTHTQTQPERPRDRARDVQRETPKRTQGGRQTHTDRKEPHTFTHILSLKITNRARKEKGQADIRRQRQTHVGY